MTGFGMADLIVLLIVLALVAAAVLYIIRAKKRGQACIGCPNGGSCGGKCHCNEKM